MLYPPAVAAFNAQASLSAKYSSKLAEPRSFERKQAWAQGTVMGLGNAAFFFLFSVVLWYGARKVAHGTMTGGQVLTTLFSAAMAAFSLGMALPSLQYFQKASAAGGVLFHVLDMKPKIDNLDPSGVIPDSCAGAIRLRNVTFAYPSRRDVDVFRSLTLDIPAGHSVALVGESGSGKSTTIALLLRFYDPQASLVMSNVPPCHAASVLPAGEPQAIVSNAQLVCLLGTSCHHNTASLLPSFCRPTDIVTQAPQRRVAASRWTGGI